MKIYDLTDLKSVLGHRRDLAVSGRGVVPLNAPRMMAALAGVIQCRQRAADHERNRGDDQ